MCPVDDFLETFSKYRGLLYIYIGDQNEPPARNEGKSNFLQKRFFFENFKSLGPIAQKLLGIFKIRLQIRIPRTRFSLKQTFLVMKI